MLEKRKGYGGGDGTIDNWYAPSLLKALMAFEIIWFYVVLYMITALIRVRRNVPSQHRQPYNLLLCTASLFALGLIVDAAYNRMRDTMFGITYIAFSCIVGPLSGQPKALIIMAGLWIFHKRSKLVIYGGGTKGNPYAGQTWKFVVDWIISASILLFVVVSVIVGAVGYSLYYDDIIYRSEYYRFTDAKKVLIYIGNAFYFILTIVFVFTGFTLRSAFKRQMGRPDVVRRFPLIWHSSHTLRRSLLKC